MCFDNNNCSCIWLIVILLLVFCCCGNGSGRSCSCGGSGGDNESAETRTVTDTCGRTVEIPKTVKSVVCVGVGSLRFTTYLDALDLLAGVEENALDIGVYKPYAYLHQDVWEKLPQTGNNGETYDEQKAKALQLTPIEVITIASIVDEETANNGEKPMIAGMYYNRFKLRNAEYPEGMPPEIYYPLYS